MAENSGKKTEEYNPKEEMRKCILFYSEKAIEWMVQRIEGGEIPFSGKFEAKAALFRIAGSKNTGYFRIVPDGTDEANTTRRLMIAVNRQGQSYEISEYQCKGTNEELLEFLRGEGLKERLCERYFQLSERWDEKMDEYPFG